MSAAIEGVAAILRGNNAKSIYGNSFAPQPRPIRSAAPGSVPDARTNEESPSTDSVSAQIAARLEETKNENQEPDLDAAVESTNRQLALVNRSLRFRIDDNTDELQIQVFDADRGKVIRSIPSDEMLRLAARIREYSGIGAMVDQSR